MCLNWFPCSTLQPLDSEDWWETFAIQSHKCNKEVLVLMEEEQDLPVKIPRYRNQEILSQVSNSEVNDQKSHFKPCFKPDCQQRRYHTQCTTQDRWGASFKAGFHRSPCLSQNTQNPFTALRMLIPVLPSKSYWHTSSGTKSHGIHSPGFGDCVSEVGYSSKGNK